MKVVPIPDARRIGQASGADRVAVLYLDDDGNFGITTWGETKAKCRAMREWCETYGEGVSSEMFDATYITGGEDD